MNRSLGRGIFLGVLVASLFCTRQALAQDRGTVGGQAGVTFQTEIAPVLAGEVGVNVLPMLQVYGTFGRMADTLPREIQDAVDVFDSSVDVSLPTLYGLGGVRAIAPSGVVRPYGVFGAGFAHLSGKIEYAGEDVTKEALDLIGLDESDFRSTEFAFELGVGAIIPVGSRAYIDAGYRYMRITGADQNVSRAYAGGGFRF